MKLSLETLNLLEHFAKINQQVVLRPGNRQITFAKSRGLVLDVRFQESMPYVAGFINFNSFLCVLSLFEKPAEIDLEFQENNVLIKNGSSEIVYKYTAINCIKSPIPFTPEEWDSKIEPFNSKVQFTLTWENIKWILNTNKVLGLPNIQLFTQNNSIFFRGFDATNDAKAIQTLDTGISSDLNFDITYSKNNFILLEDNYNICLNGNGVLRFTGNSLGTTYYIAPDPITTDDGLKCLKN